MKETTKRINLISGPRNISTALMYSFANREDTEVVDEPMYAYYLDHTKIDYHPGTAEILRSLPTKMAEVKQSYFFNPIEDPIYFIKGMAHHYIDVELNFLLSLNNLFLIRDPYQLIASFAQVIEQPTIQDIGLKREWEICQFLISNGQKPIVIDSNETLEDPEQALKNLCAKLQIPFSNRMLSWDKGPIRQDGCWAKYWYKNVWNSNGFKKQSTSSRKLPESLKQLYEESRIYYDQLKSHC